MEFGQKKKDIVEAGDYLRNFPKGETLCRFLYEQDDWDGFREHYTNDNKSFPCTRDRNTCPGCIDPDDKVNRAGRKYATQVYLVKTQKVTAMRIPVSLSDRLAIRAERNGGTLLTRDFVVLKSGSGLDTEYDADSEEKYDLDLNALRAQETISIQSCWEGAFAEVWGKDWKPAAPVDTTAATRLAQSAARGAAAAAKEQEFSKDKGDQDPPSEPATTSDAGEQDGELTEAQVRAMRATPPAVYAVAHTPAASGHSIPVSESDPNACTSGEIMNNLRTLFLGAVPLLSTSAALAQNGNMMGGAWGGGWMGGYGGIWMPILLVAVVVAVIVMIFRRK